MFNNNLSGGQQRNSTRQKFNSRRRKLRLPTTRIHIEFGSKVPQVGIATCNNVIFSDYTERTLLFTAHKVQDREPQRQELDRMHS